MKFSILSFAKYIFGKIKCNQIKAFSLIELLISLITISVILASLAPVITHKMKHGGISIGTKKLSMACPSSVGSQCTLCLGNQCIACPISCGNQFKNTLTCKCETCTVANCVNCASGANGCDRCKAGYQKSGNSCVACSAGYYSTEGGSCQKCGKGTKSNSGSGATGCVSCNGTNEYQDQEGQSTCKTCATGFVPSNRQSCASCSAGTYWNGSGCVNCSAGSYSAANATGCTPCGAGTYQPSAGQAGCLSCNGFNQYQDGSGQTGCKTCGANSVPNSSHTGCNSTCQSKSDCTGNNYFDGCRCQPCTGGQVPTSDKLSCYTPSTAPTSCPDGEYLANSKCNPCPTGCAKCSSETSCSECTNSTGDDPEYLLDGGQCKKYKKPTSQAICNEITENTTIYIPDDYTNPTAGGFCMKKRNAGDNGGPSIDYTGTISLHQAGSTTAANTCPDTNGSKCCWYGYSGKYEGRTEVRTAANEKCSTSPGSINRLSTVGAFNYEGCKRTVCNWYAADYICRNVESTNKKHLWNLPTQANLNSLREAINNGPTSKTDSEKFAIQRWSGTNGLQLCQSGDGANTNGSPRCDHASRCSGSGNGYCYPNGVWGRESSSTNAYDGWLYYSFNVNSGGSKGYAYSVRCVLEKYVE